MLEAHLILANASNVRKTPHTTHKGGSRGLAHVQSLLSRLASREKKAQQLLSAGLALSSI
jgi:hypothetical protein